MRTKINKTFLKSINYSPNLIKYVTCEELFELLRFNKHRVSHKVTQGVIHGYYYRFQRKSKIGKWPNPDLVMPQRWNLTKLLIWIYEKEQDSNFDCWWLKYQVFDETYEECTNDDDTPLNLY